MSKNFVSAGIVVAGLVIWLGSGNLRGSESTQAEDRSREGVRTAGEILPDETRERVRVTLMDAEARTRNLTLRGRTDSKRTVDVKAEITGQVVARPVDRGMQVEKGDLLCEIAVDDRAVTLKEARAAFETAKIEHQGSLRLKTKGLLSDVAIANSVAKQEAAAAHLHRQELNLARTRVVAPFSGVVEDLHMNAGDYAVPGAPCATLIDLDPMLVLAHVTEAEVDSLTQGQVVTGTTTTGRSIDGRVTFVARQSDEVTRTYPVEITVANEDYGIRSGLTVTLLIEVERVAAHQVAPSLLTLNDAGDVGLRILDSANRVAFRAVEILEDGADGMWVTGLPGTVNLITVGQEYVALGDIVEPVFGSTGKRLIVSR
ncbi:MAG: efflux RND transporter periplasmic adaptor subunit [Halioglobus sp.]|nr:efflux RND transporter periplasmic adaptor subunit [Halioglobus sp.]